MRHTNGGVGVIIGAAVWILLWLTLSIGPTLALAWVAWHFISKYW